MRTILSLPVEDTETKHLLPAGIWKLFWPSLELHKQYQTTEKWMMLTVMIVWPNIHTLLPWKRIQVSRKKDCHQKRIGDMAKTLEHAYAACWKNIWGFCFPNNGRQPTFSHLQYCVKSQYLVTPNCSTLHEPVKQVDILISHCLPREWDTCRQQGPKPHNKMWDPED